MDPNLEEDVPIVRLAPAFGRGWRLGGVLAAILVAGLVAKPWGTGRPSPTREPVATPRPRATLGAFGGYIIQGSRPYDPEIFGHYEAKPAWEIWPAGYVVEIGFAGPLPMATDAGGGSGIGGTESPLSIPPGASAPGAPGEAIPTLVPSRPFEASFDPSAPPTGGPHPASGSTGAAPATAAPSPPPGTTVLIDLGRAPNVGVIGVNTPIGITIRAAGLWRLDGARLEPIGLVELEAPWGTGHFHVYGLAAADGGRVLDPWLPAVYRLDLVVDGPGLAGADVSVGLLVHAQP